MITTRTPLLVLFMAALLGVAACQKQQPADDSAVLATVNGENITEKDYQHYLQLRQTRQEPIANKEQERKVVLDEMVDRVLLSQRAVEQKLDQDPEVYYLLKRLRENVLVQAAIRNMLKEGPVSDDELKARFEKEAANTHKTEYQVRHVLVKTEEEAKAAIKQLKGGANFATVAKQKSIDVQSGKNGGSIGWVNQGMVVPEFFDAVTKLEKGAMTSEPVKSDFGWHVIKVEDTRSAKIPTFEQFMADKQTKANFYRRVQDERIEKMVKDLRASAKIDIK
jgi:peptidyl-prolyl cis-trans isomerase C